MSKWSRYTSRLLSNDRPLLKPSEITSSISGRCRSSSSARAFLLFSSALFGADQPHSPPAAASRTASSEESAHPRRAPAAAAKSAKRSRASRNPAIDADEAKPACRIIWTRVSSRRGGTGRADRFFATRLRASTNEITPSEMPLPPREAAMPSPEREARRLAAARLFSRARTASTDATSPAPKAPTPASTATTPLSATITPPRLSTYGARIRCPRPAWQRRCTEAPSPRSSRRKGRGSLRSPAKTGRQGQSASR